MSVRVTGWGGIGEIGGNKLLLEDGDWQVLLDFGLSFGAFAKYFEEFLRPRATAGTFDYLRADLLPPLQGLYRPELEALPQVDGFWEAASSSPGFRSDVRPAAVLLTHAHADHLAHVSFLRPDVPIVASATTTMIAKAIQDVGIGGMDAETVFMAPRELKNAVLESVRNAPRSQRPWLVLDPEKWTTAASDYWATAFIARGADEWSYQSVEPMLHAIEDHTVLSFPVDHSIPGARGYAVETSKGWVGYTGDIRLHGQNGETTRQFAEELAKLDLHLLICEGTQASSPLQAGELNVQENVARVVSQAEGLVVGDFGPRNVERLLTFLSAARDAGRQLVVLAKDALLLHAMHTVDPTIPLPNSLAGLYVYSDRRGVTKAWQRFVDAEYASAMVDSDAIEAAPGDFVMALSFFDAARLLDINFSGGVWIYSSSEAYNEAQVQDAKRLRNWIALLGMELQGAITDEDKGHDPFHASGHASGPDLLKFIEIARPRQLLPVHIEENGLEFYRAHVPPLGIELLEPLWGKAIEIHV